jgi:gamma-glutamylcyclotransferase
MAKLPIFTAPQSEATADFRWFVYGSTLDLQALAAWCGEHGYKAPDPAAARPATLAGWRLAFNVQSRFWGGVVASLVEDPASSVEGIVWSLPASALGFVRHKEGVVSGLFEPRQARCLPAGDKEPVDCLVFVAAPARTVPEAPAAPRFVDTLIAGAKAWGLSPAWIARLEAVPRGG